jgi:hypothetical protein
MAVAEGRLAGAIAALILVDLTVVGTYLYATRIGKHHVWAEVLDPFRVAGEREGLDLGCRRGAVAPDVGRRARLWAGITVRVGGRHPVRARFRPQRQRAGLSYGAL